MSGQEREALDRAIERMERARRILTGGDPRPECNWGMLDTADLKAARAAQPAAVPAAFMWQHDETGRTGFVDAWQVENGFEAANPRLKIVGQLQNAPQPAAPAVPQGWRLVPVELPDAMAAASGLDETTGSLRGAWRDMLAAAPQAPGVKESLTVQQAPAVGLKPLSLEQLEKCWPTEFGLPTSPSQRKKILTFAGNIQAAHGITSAPANNGEGS